MQKLINDNWQFAKLPLGSALSDALALPADAWRDVDIPHDWLIENADDLYQSGAGWYRRALDVPADFADRTWLIRFDGVYMDCDVIVNGQTLATHRNGYTAFDVDLTPALKPGANAIVVCVRHQSPCSRWYSGAGIFRDVTLWALPKRHIAPDGVYVHSAPAQDGAWRMIVDIELEGEGERPGVFLRLEDADGREIAAAALSDTGDAMRAALTVRRPKLWGCDSPALYRLTCACGDQVVALRVGLRKAEFDPRRGFILNGVPTKLRGVCLHHDLGALGSAFNAAAFRRQIRLMKRMGANALRTTHNPPAARALDICDEEGVLVIDEFTDVWELSKTKYDYARFFPECWQADVRSWVRRDRSHPCVVMWSLGNEIPDIHVSGRGAALTRALKAAVESHDLAFNARATQGSNYMPWPGAQHCADILKLAGYNYAEKYYDAHRQAHPDWVVYGSETASLLSSRGVYHFPAATKILSDEDLQCSALGNSNTSWGTQDMRRCLADDLNDPASMGQFLWSGTDYIGEPTPYHTRSCYFGMADTAGFEKDVYYQVQAAWTDAPMIHIGMRWDWNDGQLIDVPVYTNAAACELFLNGESLGRTAVDRRDPERSVAWFRVPYAAGELEAAAYDAAGRAVARDRRTSFGDSAKLALTAERGELRADGEDVACVAVHAVDAQGRAVENAADRVFVTVEGAARLLGLDNGDSTDADGYKVADRRLFNGKLMILVGAADEPGEAVVKVAAPGLEGARIRLKVAAAEGRPGRSRALTAWTRPSGASGAVDARRIELTCDGDRALTPQRPGLVVRARLLPESAAAQPIAWRVVNAAGIDSACAKVEPFEGGARVTGLGDGQVCLRAACANGAAHPRVISQIELSLSGFGATGLDPYGFIAGGLCDFTHGEITAGNEQGIAFARDGVSMAGFRNVDFGAVGSDEITLPVFELDSEPCEIKLWLGDPLDGGRLLAALPYDKKSIWNTYQSQTWTLPERLTGVQTLCFELNHKIHLKGFSFTRQSRAWLRLRAGDADEVYGDDFARDGGAIRGIGNNVSVVLRDMDFEGARRARLTITGSTPLAVNPIQVRVSGSDGGETLTECAFARAGAAAAQAFDVALPGGRCIVTFVFLPGSRFDFEALQFERAD